MILTINLGNGLVFDLLRLPVSPRDWPPMNYVALMLAIRTRRAIVRWHRDQVGDDRCIIDDHLVALTIADTPLAFPGFNEVEGMEQCRRFHANRQAPDDVPQPPITKAERNAWDNDLRRVMHKHRNDTPRLERVLLGLLQKLHAELLHFRATQPNTTYRDDRRLYRRTLPEKRKACTVLPRGFLDVNPGACAGCPQFWASHAACPPGVRHNEHGWGPCGLTTNYMVTVTAP